MNSNQSHTHSASDSGHYHNLNTNVDPGGVMFTQANNGSSAQAGFTGGYPVVQLYPYTQYGNANISVGGTNIDHTHSFTSGGMNSNTTHSHTVTVTGTSGATGSGTAFSNLPPYYALAYIMKG